MAGVLTSYIPSPKEPSIRATPYQTSLFDSVLPFALQPPETLTISFSGPKLSIHVIEIQQYTLSSLVDASLVFFELAVKVYTSPAVMLPKCLTVYDTSSSSLHVKEILSRTFWHTLESIIPLRAFAILLQC